MQNLIDLMIEQGLEIPNRESVVESISDAVANDRIRALTKNNITIGFFTWRLFIKNEKKYVYIENLCILKKYRKSSNLLSLRKFFRNLYPNISFAYWDSQKKNRWCAFK